MGLPPDSRKGPQVYSFLIVLVRQDIPLAPLTTMGVGGPARRFVEVSTEAELVEAVRFARSYALPLFVLGGGSNLVIADEGFPGLVLKVAMTDVSLDGGELTAGAGCDWDTVVAQAVEAGCAGLECLSGIPGTVGATPVQNVGAYGQEVSETITEVRAIDLLTLEPVTLTSRDCRFAYRSSIFNTTDRERYIIVQVAFTLRFGGEPTLRYADLHSHFEGCGDQPTLAEVRDAVREIRHRKGMLIVPGEEDARSAGSFFKNPMITASIYEQLRAEVGSNIPSYPAGEGLRKLSAAWLVEQAGFTRGYAKGAAGISSKHALAIVNRGGATAADIIALKDEIQGRVLERFEIELQPEPVFLGFG
jgi:UDP-N-acetylmuramate dehydrogenase